MPVGPPVPDVAANLDAVRGRIRAAAEAAGRDASAVSLVAVSKAHDAARVEPALAAGYQCFGENRVQEAAGKWPALRERYRGIALHLIGPLQTNKVRDALALFDVIETVDRPKLAEALAQEIDRSGRSVSLRIEVNVGEEPQKAGVPPEELPAFVALCRESLGLPVTGLMCIPPLGEEPAPYFALLAKLAARHGLGELSMGMSADYEVAVAFGATSVRVGTAIFGERA